MRPSRIFLRTGERERYLSLGANFNALGGWGQVEAYKHINKGTAFDLGYSRNFLGFDTSLRSSVFRDLDNSRSGTGANRKETETSLSVVKRLANLLPSLSLNLGTSVDHTTYAELDTETRWRTSQSVGSPVGNFSNTTNTAFTDGEMIDSDGQIAFNTRTFR